jgi:hypothetical protein
MGYTTDFDGVFTLDRQLSEEHHAYLDEFSRTRRMKRMEQLTQNRTDPLREKVGLPVGPDGAYFVGEDGAFGQAQAMDIVDYNSPPEGQPGLWCQWIPTNDGSGIEWDQGEKFYEYVEWLIYIIDHFLKPWGYVLNGSVYWRGEEFYDMGTITVDNNEVSYQTGAFNQWEERT